MNWQIASLRSSTEQKDAVCGAWTGARTSQDRMSQQAEIEAEDERGWWASHSRIHAKPRFVDRQKSLAG